MERSTEDSRFFIVSAVIIFKIVEGFVLLILLVNYCCRINWQFGRYWV